jgi:hypothetical protein
MKLGVSIAALLTAAAVAAPASALEASGSVNGFNWTATSYIVGQTSTATVASGGNPIYAATAPKYSGVVTLIMHETGGDFICSGSLIGRRSVLTAGHCVSSGAGTANPITTTAYFNNDANPDVVPFAGQGATTAIGVSAYYVNPGYTGEVVDSNDIAIVRLAEDAPAYAQIYGLYTDDLHGADYNVAGYGRRSDVGGAIGADLGTGRRRQGDNRYDFQLGDAEFQDAFGAGTGNAWNLIFGQTNDMNQVVISDFDNGTGGQDSSCRLATDGFGFAADPKYCNLGRGATEASTAPGDSGGPQFVNGKVASVTSFGLTFGSDFGDVDNFLNDSWGEFNGFVPVSAHLDFIRGAIPEPTTWAMMIMGLGGMGAMIRRRKMAAVRA